MVLEEFIEKQSSTKTHNRRGKPAGLFCLCRSLIFGGSAFDFIFLATKLVSSLHSKTVRSSSPIATVERCENVTASAEKIIAIIKLSGHHPFQFTARASPTDSQCIKTAQDCRRLENVRVVSHAASLVADTKRDL